jgi:hypothetical protein
MFATGREALGMGFQNVLALQIEFRLQQRQGKISW